MAKFLREDSIMLHRLNPSRRQIVASLSLLASSGLSLPAFAQASSFPSRRFNVIIPTGQGGNADMMVRAFTASWSPFLKNHPFEFEYYPSANGQVGYELFVNKREHDGYTLLFGNMGPEIIMYATQEPH